MPHGNVDDGRLDVKASSLGTGTTPARHHSPAAKLVFSQEEE
jgi:hypothetical protein